MLAGRRVHDWGQTGSLLALTANANRDPKRRKRPFGIHEFVPRDLRRHFVARRGTGLTKQSLHALKPLFLKDTQNGT